jgi:hypothetical protein
VPELDAWLRRSSDVMLATVADQLAAGFEEAAARPLIAVALDFWTWQRLDREGLDDEQAAELMAATIRATG